MAWTGFRKPLEYGDLWQLNWHDLSRNLVPTFDYYWPLDLNRGLNKKHDDLNKSKQHEGNGYQNGKHDSVMHSYQSVKGQELKKEAGVFTTIVKSFGWQYFYGFVLRTTTDLMMFVAPLILK